jgi:hypothetical protein
MNVPDQFQKVGILLAQYGFIPVLEKLAMTAVASVEISRMARQYPLHHLADRHTARFQQKMNMVGNKRPGEARGFRLLKNPAESIQEIVSIFIVAEYVPTLYPPKYNMMKRSRSVNS